MAVHRFPALGLHESVNQTAYLSLFQHEILINIVFIFFPSCNPILSVDEN